MTLDNGRVAASSAGWLDDRGEHCAYGVATHRLWSVRAENFHAFMALPVDTAPGETLAVAERLAG